MNIESRISLLFLEDKLARVLLHPRILVNQGVANSFLLQMFLQIPSVHSDREASWEWGVLRDQECQKMSLVHLIMNPVP